MKDQLREQEINLIIEKNKAEKALLKQNTLLALDSIKGFVDYSDIDKVVKQAWKNRLKSEINFFFNPEITGYYIKEFGTYENFKQAMTSYKIGGLDYNFASKYKLGYIFEKFQAHIKDWKTLKDGTNKFKTSQKMLEAVYTYYCRENNIPFVYDVYREETHTTQNYMFQPKSTFKIGEWNVKYLSSQDAIEIKGITDNDIFELVYLEIANEISNQITYQYKTNEYKTPTWYLNNTVSRWERAKLPNLDTLKAYLVDRFVQDNAILGALIFHGV